MIGIRVEPWGPLERWSPTLFLLAGGILTVYAAINGMNAFTEMTLNPTGNGLGFLFGFLGLLGLYPSLADRSPWLARVGAAGAVLGAVAFSVFTVNTLAELLGLVSGDPPAWSLFVVLATTGFVLGYLSFGVASLRSGVHPRTVGLVLLMPATVIIVMFAHMVAGYESPATVFVISSGQAMGHLAIGGSLQTKSSSTDREEASSDGEQEVVAHD